MEMARLSRNLPGLAFLMTILALSTHAQTVATESKSCNEIRRDVSQTLKRTYEHRAPAYLLDELLARLLDIYLPPECQKAKPIETSSFNPSSAQDMGGPLGTLGNTGTIYTMGSKTRRKREAAEEEQQAAADLAQSHMREKRNAEHSDQADNLVDNGAALARDKRFFGGFTGGSSGVPYFDFTGMALGGPPGGPGAGSRPEVSETQQMMKTLLLLSRYQKQRLRRENKKYSSGNYYGEQFSLGNGMYGDMYPGRKKREAETSLESHPLRKKREAKAAVSSDNEAEAKMTPLSRKKRFLFGEPAEGPAGPNMLSIMMGTARDPNTGKKIEFGGDYMKNMMRTSFMHSMPFMPQTPPGKEHSDFVKNMAPVWYLSRMQRMMDFFGNGRPMSQPARYPNYANPYSRPNPYQARNPDGFYGDRFSYRRGKRSVDDSSANLKEAESTAHSRHKRASDGISVGDITIPLEFFKPPERSSEEYAHDYRRRRPPPRRRYTPSAYDPSPSSYSPPLSQNNHVHVNPLQQQIQQLQHQLLQEKLKNAAQANMLKNAQWGTDPSLLPPINPPAPPPLPSNLPPLPPTPPMPPVFSPPPLPPTGPAFMPPSPNFNMNG